MVLGHPPPSNVISCSPVFPVILLQITKLHTKLRRLYRHNYTSTHTHTQIYICISDQAFSMLFPLPYLALSTLSCSRDEHLAKNLGFQDCISSFAPLASHNCQKSLNGLLDSSPNPGSRSRTAGLIKAAASPVPSRGRQQALPDAHLDSSLPPLDRKPPQNSNHCGYHPPVHMLNFK